MSIPITTWLRAHFALLSTAMQSRGFAEINARDHTAERWPRTNGGDVISIAAVIDPLIEDQPFRFGRSALLRRWRSCMNELEHHALLVPHLEYVDNHAFWNLLPAISAYLHAERAPLPPPTFWDALLVRLAEPTTWSPR